MELSGGEKISTIQLVVFIQFQHVIVM